MQIEFYNCSSPTNVVSKNLGNALKTINIDIYEQVDVVNPVFKIDKTDISSSANYMVCGDPLNRSYFITAMDFTNAKTTYVAGHVDVLSTFLDTSHTFNFLRGAGDINEMDDSSYPISDYMVEQYFPLQQWTDIFSNKGSGRQFLLRTITADAEAANYFDLNDNSIFWDGTFATNERGEVSYYQCWIFSPTADKSFYPVMIPETTITGYPLINNQDIIRYDNKAWRWNSKENWLRYLGATT